MMKVLFVSITLLVSAWAQTLSNEYLPPVENYSGDTGNIVETNFIENEPAHILANDGYRYKAVKRFRLRRRRDVSELSNNYLPPAETVPETYEIETSDPVASHSIDNDGYRYRSVKRYRLRHRRRRDVNELSNNYLPPEATIDSGSLPAYSGSGPIETYDIQTSEPTLAHSLGDDGYRYRAIKRYRLRHRRRRDISELSNNYLPPLGASAPAPAYSAPVESIASSGNFAPSSSENYEIQVSEPTPAHSLGDDGYRYKTNKRYRLRLRLRRRY